MNLAPFLKYLDVLHDCALCPRNCHVDRFTGKTGYCRSDASFNISSICIHKGEEPAISGTKGICNIFFTNCNLQCLYCQNHQISDRRVSRTFSNVRFEDVLKQIMDILDTGIDMVGFVSPSHFIPHTLAIIDAIQACGYHPRWVYNSNGYDKVETLRSLEGIIDIYLPDLKYMDSGLSESWSDAKDYPEIAGLALKEMFRQKGATLILNEDNTAESGLIVRHLVLPGQVENSLSVIRYLASELSPRVHVSLMSQYFPISKIKGRAMLDRLITKNEYMQAIDELEKLEMENGWIQEFESAIDYRPDFEKYHPFENI
jgi:putative pyruvate formate lyase activating enzyme